MHHKIDLFDFTGGTKKGLLLGEEPSLPKLFYIWFTRNQAIIGQQIINKWKEAVEVHSFLPPLMPKL